MLAMLSARAVERVCPTSRRAKPRSRQSGCVSTIPTQAQSQPYLTKVVVATTRPSSSMQKHPSGESVRSRLQSSSVWFHPAKCDNSSASLRSAGLKRLTSDEICAPDTSALFMEDDGCLIVTVFGRDEKICFTDRRYCS